MYFASLPWYDLAEVQSATDLLWACLAHNLCRRGVLSVPGSLDRLTPFRSQWTSGRLLFSQACGYDILAGYTRHLRVLATPVYRSSAHHGPYYSSLIVIRRDSGADQLEDLRGSRCVVNDLSSHSGMNSLRALVAPMHRNGRFFSEIWISGSHELSLQAIARRQADVAAIDSVTYALIQRHRPWLLAGTEVLCCTASMPAPPYVVSSRLPDGDVEKIRVALQETLEEPTVASAKQALLLDRVEVVSADLYRPIADWEFQALTLGYTEMASCMSLGGTAAWEPAP